MLLRTIEISFPMRKVPNENIWEYLMKEFFDLKLLKIEDFIITWLSCHDLELITWMSS